MVNRVKKRLKDEVRKKDLEKELTPEDSTAEPNNNIIKQAHYYVAVKAIAKIAKNDAEFLNMVAEYNKQSGIHLPQKLYRVALQLGSAKKCLDSFQKTASKQEKISSSDRKVIFKLSQFLDFYHKNKER